MLSIECSIYNIKLCFSINKHRLHSICGYLHKRSLHIEQRKYIRRLLCRICVIKRPFSLNKRHFHSKQGYLAFKLLIFEKIEISEHSMQYLLCKAAFEHEQTPFSLNLWITTNEIASYLVHKAISQHSMKHLRYKVTFQHKLTLFLRKIERDI